ncbi:GDP-perosamine synthase [Aquicella siphonis]|uniref:GDP-perosamine synthase n=1 Tax=Aquicella siphonis TaxID=254247 RepID=A0A5E4PJE6_9COXI|nr:aminotransferase class I/II-fold pyridoxal phosphate-dependent enzyme [Aquicella siphonis]VVC76471.1 GDP-perosamine synthase [Aquicella siphonis]
MNNKQALLNNLHDNIREYCDTYFDFSFNPEKPVVRLHEPTSGSEEIFAALETMLSTFTTMGKKVRAFENQYAAYNGTQYSVMSNSGSSANLLAVAALANPFTPDHLKPGDEVIVPALSWSTTIWPIIQHNLVPVLVDCDLNDFNLDLEKLERAIGPRTRAIKLVHVYGNPCNMDAVMALAKKHNLFVIEDCCEAMGAAYDGKPVGSFGLVGNFSFFFSHHISTMEGGISVTNDFNFTETMRILRAHGWSREADEHQKYVNLYPDIDPRFIFINLGYNLRPTEVNAAMGQLQLPKLDGLIDKRRETADFYARHLSRHAEFFHFQQETPKGKHVWFGFPVILKDGTPFSVKDITAYMQQHHIETRPIIAGNMARHPAFNMYEHRVAGDLSSADTIMKKGFAFACHHAVDERARQYVVDTIDAFVEAFLNGQIQKTA